VLAGAPRAYPGARVDAESIVYSYLFSPELYADWKWSEKLAAQPEIMAYFHHVAERFDLRRSIRFDCRVTGALWDPDAARYTVHTATGPDVRARYLVMAVGHLSSPRPPAFEGLDTFAGEWVQTSRWPKDRTVDLAGKRVGVIGTGSSGVQVVPKIAEQAAHLTVFQRTANFCIPAQNTPADPELHSRLSSDVPGLYRDLLTTPALLYMKPQAGKASDFTPAEQQALLEERWTLGAQHMNYVFTDQGSNSHSNEIVSEFVRSKIRQIVKDPDTVSKLLPREYPISTRRLGVNIGYYETFNRENVSLVDLKAEPIVRFDETGIQTTHSHVDLDTVVFALGFEAFRGSIDATGIRNPAGEAPTDKWTRGPQSYLGPMTSGFPNLFFIAAAGSPAVLANLFPLSEYHVNLVAEIIAHLESVGATTVETTPEVEAAWSAHVDDQAKPLLRRVYPNYMVHINRDDGSRRFIPWSSGFDRYHKEVREIVENDFDGFVFK
jgi:cation diffusion facilitator CzcD-associated flavoprotein CzcO